MFRVIAVRSLKFSEHRDNENTKMEDNEVIVKKRTESYGGRRQQFNVANKYSELDKLQTPSVVAEIIQRECIKRKKEPRGVWSSMGVAYNTHGTPDLELGEAKTLAELKKRARKDSNKKQESADVATLAKDGEVVQSRQQLDALVSLFIQTKDSLSQVNLFNRGDPEEEGNKGGRFQKNGSKKKKNDSNDDRESRLQKRDRGPKTWEQMTTAERLSNLPRWEDNMKQGPKQVKAKKQDKLKHLKESRLKHLERWRTSFDRTREEKKNQMLHALVQRGNDREAVYADVKMFNRAQRLVSIKLRDRWAEKQPVKQLLKQHSTIWDQTKSADDQSTWDDPFSLSSAAQKKEELKKLKAAKRKQIIEEQRRIAQDVNEQLAKSASAPSII